MTAAATALRHLIRRRPGRVALAVLGALIAAAIAMRVASFLLSGPLLAVGGSAPAGPADALLVLGGDAEGRAPLAASFYRRGLAPMVIVSGDGDCQDAVVILREEGVPPDAVRVDCVSGSTAENAVYSTRLLEAEGARSAIIVTSWFHTRRALRCFEATAPALRFDVAGAGPPRPLWRHVFSATATQVSQEYIKILWYELGDRCG